MIFYKLTIVPANRAFKRFFHYKNLNEIHSKGNGKSFFNFWFTINYGKRMFLPIGSGSLARSLSSSSRSKKSPAPPSCRPCPAQGASDGTCSATLLPSSGHPGRGLSSPRQTDSPARPDAGTPGCDLPPKHGKALLSSPCWFCRSS